MAKTKAKKKSATKTKVHCRICGCTDDNCTGCRAWTGTSCYWVAPDLCSACATFDSTGHVRGVRSDRLPVDRLRELLEQTGDVASSEEAVMLADELLVLRGVK